MATNINYSISGVPDLDQKRKGLLNNGKEFCIPVSMMNWMYFMAQHGAPHAVMGPSNMKNEFFVVSNIMLLASLMDTDPDDGTSHDDAVEGLVEWLDIHNVVALPLHATYADDVNITVGALASQVQLGGLVSVNMGRYKKTIVKFERISGHAMTMIGLQSAGDKASITVHDPAEDDGDLNKQSAPKAKKAALSHMTGNFEGESVVLTRWEKSTNPYRFIDGFHTIKPFFALTNVKTTLAMYWSADWGKSVESASVPLPFRGEVGDIAIHPLEPVAVVVETEGKTLWKLDLISRTFEKMTSLPENARAIAYGGRSNRLYVATGRSVLALDSQAQERERTTLTFAPEAIVYDAQSQSVVAASTKAKALARLNTALEVREQDELPELPGAGRLQLSYSYREGALLLSRIGSNDVAALQLRRSQSPARTTSRLEAHALTSNLTPYGRNQRIAAENGKIATFDLSGDRVAGSLFDGLPAGSVLRTPQPWSNIDPQRARKPEWRDGSRIELARHDQEERYIGGTTHG